jgi:hypothetical protein
MSTKNDSMNLTNKGKLDKRFKSTKNIQSQVSNIKLTKSGRPDKRTTPVKIGTIKIKKADGQVKGSSALGKKINLL